MKHRCNGEKENDGAKEAKMRIFKKALSVHTWIRSAAKRRDQRNKIARRQQKCTIPRGRNEKQGKASSSIHTRIQQQRDKVAERIYFVATVDEQKNGNLAS